MSEMSSFVMGRVYELSSNAESYLLSKEWNSRVDSATVEMSKRFIRRRPSYAMLPPPPPPPPPPDPVSPEVEEPRTVGPGRLLWTHPRAWSDYERRYEEEEEEEEFDHVGPSGVAMYEPTEIGMYGGTPQVAMYGTPEIATYGLSEVDSPVTYGTSHQVTNIDLLMVLKINLTLLFAFLAVSVAICIFPGREIRLLDLQYRNSYILLSFFEICVCDICRTGESFYRILSANFVRFVS